MYGAKTVAKTQEIKSGDDDGSGGGGIDYSIFFSVGLPSSVACWVKTLKTRKAGGRGVNSVDNGEIEKDRKVVEEK